jgi:RNA polymerase sigma-70 factor (ECF subfamily)
MRRVSTSTRATAPPGGALTFELFFEAERRRLFRALYLMSGSVQEAEELVQDAFLKLWERWDRVSVMEDPVGYLYRVALNLARSRLRRVVRAAKLPFLPERTVEPYSAADARDAVVRALASLSARQRQALVLADLLDMDTGEAAALMRISPSTVRSLVSEGHRRMRAVMESSDE